MTDFKMTFFNRSFVLSLLLVATSLGFTSLSFAEEPKGNLSEPVAAKTLEGLLQQVQQFQQQENSLNKQRETIFKQNKQDQQALLNKANKELKAQQKIADDLKASFDKNEKR